MIDCFNTTIEIMRAIGIPSQIDGEKINFTPNHFMVASKNKVDLLFLEALTNKQIHKDNRKLLKLRNRQRSIYCLSLYLADLFDKNSIFYAIMKTLRPFSYAGSDVDILFSTNNDLTKAENLLRNHGFTVMGGSERFTSTLFRKDFEVVADLQSEIMVSSLPYINKQIVLQHLTNYDIDGQTVITLGPVADLVLIAAHALYKEHIFTLADFYSVVLTISKGNLFDFCLLANATKCAVPAITLLTWVQKLSVIAFGSSLPLIDAALIKLGDNWISKTVNNRKINLPTKISIDSISLTIANKIWKDSYSRSFLLSALYDSFARKRLIDLIHHLKRESY